MPEKDFKQLDENAHIIHGCGFEELTENDPFAALKLLKEWFNVTTKTTKIRNTATGMEITEKLDGPEAVQNAARELIGQEDTETVRVVISIRRDLNFFKWLVTKEKVRVIPFDVEPPNLAF
jgi:hypothetical protein